jgi:hypothetical protein
MDACVEPKSRSEATVFGLNAKVARREVFEPTWAQLWLLRLYNRTFPEKMRFKLQL